MKCYKRFRAVVIITLLVTMLTATHLHTQKRSKEDKPQQEWTARIQLNRASVYDSSLHNINKALSILENSTYHSWKVTTQPGVVHGTPVILPVTCVEKNCQEFLSKEERTKMNVCKEEVRTIENYSGQINGSDCRFLPEVGRHPVALVSAEGSGNTWTRGLLERATGICTGYYYCDKIMRAHGFVGENIGNGKVLVVKTHTVPPTWVGESNKSNDIPDPNYSAAVFILRNPVMSAIAEWNRRASQEILGKQVQAIAHERHTHNVPKDFFKGKEWDDFLHWYLKEWRERLENWVINQDTHPVHVLRYENLQRDTLGEVRKVLDFLRVSYDLGILKENLMKDYSEFHRSHKKTNFEHYSLQQKQLLRSAIINATELAERKNKAQLLQLNEYLLSIHDY